MNSTTTYVELLYFSPFDINKIPERILETMYEQAFGQLRRIPSDHDFSHQLTLPELLLAICDNKELLNGIRKELIKYHT